MECSDKRLIQLISKLSNAEKLTSRFWVLNRKSNGSF